MSNTKGIDWDRLTKLADGQSIADVSPTTCRLADVIVQGAKSTEAPLMELAMQVAIWREAFEELEQEFRLPTGDARKVLGFSDVQKITAENDNLKRENASLRYTMQNFGEKLVQKAQAN